MAGPGIRVGDVVDADGNDGKVRRMRVIAVRGDGAYEASTSITDPARDGARLHILRVGDFRNLIARPVFPGDRIVETRTSKTAVVSEIMHSVEGHHEVVRVRIGELDFRLAAVVQNFRFEGGSGIGAWGCPIDSGSWYAQCLAPAREKVIRPGEVHTYVDPGTRPREAIREATKDDAAESGYMARPTTWPITFREALKSRGDVARKAERERVLVGLARALFLTDKRVLDHIKAPLDDAPPGSIVLRSSDTGEEVMRASGPGDEPRFLRWARLRDRAYELARKGHEPEHSWLVEAEARASDVARVLRMDGRVRDAADEREEDAASKKA